MFGDVDFDPAMAYAACSFEEQLEALSRAVRVGKVSWEWGRRFGTLNILDEEVRDGLAIEVDTSLPAQRVVRVLTWRGTCQRL